MLDAISPDGAWFVERIKDRTISRDWTYWPRALEAYPNIRVKPIYQISNRFRALRLKFGPQFPPGSGQPIDWILATQILGRVSHNSIILATANLSLATVLWLRRHGLLSVPIWGALVGVADRLATMSNDLTKEIVSKYSMADRLLVWGPSEKAFLESLGLTNVELIPFGVDTSFWEPAQTKQGDFILSVGSDHLRDFDTLVAASPFALCVVSNHASIKPYLNVSHVQVQDPDCAGLRTLYREARIVSVITRDAMQPSGQITVLQAMACGRPVILTRTRGIWSDKLVSGENCLLVPVGDAQALREAIQFLWDNPVRAEAIGAAARATVLAHYPFKVIGAALARPLLEMVE